MTVLRSTLARDYLSYPAAQLPKGMSAYAHPLANSGHSGVLSN